MKGFPWRVVFALILLVLVALFSGFNLAAVDISVGFHTFTGVPLFLALFIAFIAGALITLPFAFTRRRRKAAAEKQRTLGDRARETGGA